MISSAPDNKSSIRAKDQSLAFYDDDRGAIVSANARDEQDPTSCVGPAALAENDHPLTGGRSSINQRLFPDDQSALTPGVGDGEYEQTVRCCTLITTETAE
jgi:hypothetical protein